MVKNNKQKEQSNPQLETDEIPLRIQSSATSQSSCLHTQQEHAQYGHRIRKLKKKQMKKVSIRDEQLQQNQSNIVDINNENQNEYKISEDKYKKNHIKNTNTNKNKSVFYDVLSQKQKKQRNKYRRKNLVLYHQVDLIKNSFVKYLTNIGFGYGLVFGTKDRQRLRKEQLKVDWELQEAAQSPIFQQINESEQSLPQIQFLNSHSFKHSQSYQMLRPQEKVFQDKFQPQLSSPPYQMSPEFQSGFSYEFMLKPQKSRSYQPPDDFELQLHQPTSLMQSQSQQNPHPILRTDWDQQHKWFPQQQLQKIRRTVKAQQIPPQYITQKFYTYFLDIGDIFPREITNQLYHLLCKLYLISIGSPKAMSLHDVVELWVNGKYYLTGRFSRIFIVDNRDKVKEEFQELCVNVVKYVTMLRKRKL